MISVVNFKFLCYKFVLSLLCIFTKILFLKNVEKFTMDWEFINIYMEYNLEFHCTFHSDIDLYFLLVEFDSCTIRCDWFFFLTFMSTHIKYITIRRMGLEICFVQMPYWKVSLNIANYIYIFQSLVETYIVYTFSECCKFLINVFRVYILSVSQHSIHLIFSVIF